MKRCSIFQSFFSTWSILSPSVIRSGNTIRSFCSFLLARKLNRKSSNMASAALGIGVCVISSSIVSVGSTISVESATSESSATSLLWPDLFPVHENITSKPAKIAIKNRFIDRCCTLSNYESLKFWGKFTQKNEKNKGSSKFFTFHSSLFHLKAVPLHANLQI